jgi:hypothetical protein
MVSGAFGIVNKVHAPCESRGSPVNLGVYARPIADTAVESAHMNEIPGAWLQILPPVFDILLQEAHVGRDAKNISTR